MNLDLRVVIVFVCVFISLVVPDKLEYLMRYVCEDGSVDAATRTADDSTYFFKDGLYWKVVKQGVAYGYPKSISADWLGVEGPVDAAFTWNDGSTFIFQGDKYWRSYNTFVEPGYPKPIASGFPGIPENVDSAIVWDPSGKTYFFKGKFYWLFDQSRAVPVPEGFPRLISEHWNGLPDDIQAAIRWEEGKMYFFHGAGYYRYDQEKNGVTKEYPLLTRQNWFHCDNLTNDETERERFGRPKDQSFSNTCSCSCSQPPATITNDCSEKEGELRDALNYGIEDLKKSIFEVERTLRLMTNQPDPASGKPTLLGRPPFEPIQTNPNADLEPNPEDYERRYTNDAEPYDRPDKEEPPHGQPDMFNKFAFQNPPFL